MVIGIFIGCCVVFINDFKNDLLLIIVGFLFAFGRVGGGFANFSVFFVVVYGYVFFFVLFLIVFLLLIIIFLLFDVVVVILLFFFATSFGAFDVFERVFASDCILFFDVFVLWIVVCVCVFCRKCVLVCVWVFCGVCVCIVVLWIIV